MRKLRFALIAALVLLVPSIRAEADTVRLDQAFIPTTFNLETDLHLDFAGAQTLTVGLGGTLARVDLYLGEFGSGPVSGNLTFDVRPTINGIPVNDDASAFARITVPASSVMPAGLPIGVFPVSFDLRPFGVSVTPGEVLALVVANPNASFPYYGLWGSFTQPFSGGTAFNRAPSLGRPTFGAPGGNHAFATFVDTAATPEPATVLLFASALVPLVASARRKSVTKSLQ